MSSEVEVKFKLKNPQVIRDKLKQLQAEFVRKEHEADFFFDTKDFVVGRSKETLRLRKTGEKGYLTFKGPVQADSTFKVREEIEVEIREPDKLAKILQRSGYQCVGKKEKEREVYQLDGVHVLVDRLPFIGYYLELEGEKDKIIAAVERLGLDMKSARKDAYSNLFGLYVQFHRPEFEKKKIDPRFTFECEHLFMLK